MPAPKKCQGPAFATLILRSLSIYLVLPSIVVAAESDDVLAKAILQKAGIRVGVCEMPRVGDGTLAAALARTGIAQVHGVAPDVEAVERARKPAEQANLLGSQVVIETGTPSALPLGDWVADLLVIADATDHNLKTISAGEVGRILSPYRGTAVVGNPANTRTLLSQQSLREWAQATGGIVTMVDDASGLWAVVKMPPLKGGDDWGHFFHASDGNPVSNDTAVHGGRFELQCYDKPNVACKYGTVVASGGRYFWVNGGFSPDFCSEPSPPMPNDLIVRNMYNGQILWRRPLELPFGRNDSLIVVTPDRVYLKNNNNVLILDPETGAELQRLVVTDERHCVSWILLCDGVLITLTGEPLQAPVVPKGLNGREIQNFHANEALRGFIGLELAGWDAASGKRLWTRTDERIDPSKLAARNGRLFFYANNNYAACLDLKSGNPIWKTTAPIRNPIRPFCIDWELNNILTSRQSSLVTDEVYLIASQAHGQTQAFSAIDGHLLWQWCAGFPFEDKTKWKEFPNSGGQYNLSDPTWRQIQYPMVVAGTLCADHRRYDLLTGKPAEQKAFDIREMGGCGHPTATSSGLLMAQGGAIYDSITGQQYVRNYMKDACGIGGGPVADGVTIKISHGCNCPMWKGFIITRSTPQRAPRMDKRLETGTGRLPVASPAVGEWTTYRANPERNGSISAQIPGSAAVRWTYTPSRGPRAMGSGEVHEYEPDANATQAISVGDRIWFGRAEGALVCLDRQTGKEQWRYWTTGRIISAPTWHAGMLYAGSCDGWVYCLDAANGTLIWRYRVAPDERLLMSQGYLSSAWPVQANVLVHDDAVFAFAGLIGELGGSALCALDARTGEPRWEKYWENQLPIQGGPHFTLIDKVQTIPLDVKIDTTHAGRVPEAVYHAVCMGQDIAYVISGLEPNAAATVRLYFVEPWERQAGKRLLDVTVNEHTGLTNFDIFAAAGGQNKAVTREIKSTTERNGNLTIRLCRGAGCRNNVVVSGIEVLIAGKSMIGLQAGGPGIPAINFQSGIELAQGMDKDLPLIPSADGQLAWFGDHLWCKAGGYGPMVCDPATGDIKPAISPEQLNEKLRPGLANTWSHGGRGQDIGVLPGGWVACGGRQFNLPLALTVQPNGRSYFISAKPNGAFIDTNGCPKILTLSAIHAADMIPVWDATDVLLCGSSPAGPVLCRNFGAYLNANSTIHPSPSWSSGLPSMETITLGADLEHPALPEDLKKSCYTPILAGNAVVFFTLPYRNWKCWGVVAVSRTGQTKLWDLPLPAIPVLGGLSLTRAGDVLVPLVDGRVVCIGSEAK